MLQGHFKQQTDRLTSLQQQSLASPLCAAALYWQEGTQQQQRPGSKLPSLVTEGLFQVGDLPALEKGKAKASCLLFYDKGVLLQVDFMLFPTVPTYFNPLRFYILNIQFSCLHS